MKNNPYVAEINGEPVRVQGWDAPGNLVLADGRRFLLRRLGDRSGDEPALDVDLKCKRLIKAARLECTADGGWILNGVRLVLPDRPPHGEWTDDEFRSLLLHARQISSHDASKVAGVAWFAGIEAPVLLRSFRELLPSSAVPDPSNPKKARREKPVARFEKDYAQVVIPLKNKEPRTEGIPRELRVMVRVIIQAGGRLAGPELRSQMQKALAQKNADNFRPDKLLLSKVGEILQNAKLLGSKYGKGAITVYWAKEKAN